MCVCERSVCVGMRGVRVCGRCAHACVIRSRRPPSYTAVPGSAAGREVCVCERCVCEWEGVHVSGRVCVCERCVCVGCLGDFQYCLSQESCRGIFSGCQNILSSVQSTENQFHSGPFHFMNISFHHRMNQN